jgi:ABC-type antimicrobial peptide transport system permease subunit
MIEERFRATLSLMFGSAALVLAAVGLYGLAARRVADRRREIGVRVALGARPVDIRRLVIGDAVRTIAVGRSLGFPVAYVASRVTGTLLYGVSPTAPHVFATAAAVLAVSAFAATLLPARRAAAIDPLVVLKE